MYHPAIIVTDCSGSHIYNPLNHGKRVVAQFILDSSSQRSYVTDDIRKSLGLRSTGQKQMSIMTFGSAEAEQQECHTVQFKSVFYLRIYGRLVIQCKALLHGIDCYGAYITHQPSLMTEGISQKVQYCIT